MGLIVVPMFLDAWNSDEPRKRTLEVNFAPCSVMAYASLARVAFPDGIYCSVGIKRVRQRAADGTERSINLGNGDLAWPRAWGGERISSVTFAASVDDGASIDAVCVIHTW